MASWKHSLFDGGVHDCLRAYFAPCCVFGQTRYRLERIDNDENPLDLDGYKTSNGACWDWFFFALPLGISCSVITSNEILRVRELYGIKGSRTTDITTATFCPCCSVLRNELEVRTREEEKWNDKHGAIDEPYTPEKPMTSALPPGVSLPGKENRAPRKDSIQSASGSVLRGGNGSRRSSASSTQQPTGDQNNAKKTSNGEVASISSNSSLSLNSSGNGGPVTCTVVGPRDRGILTPVMERLSEDTLSTAKRSRVGTSSPPQGENIPLGSIQEGTPPGSDDNFPLVSRPTSPRKSIDRPGTPIPLQGPMSPTLSARSGRSGRSFHRVPLVPTSDAVPSPVQELIEDGQAPAEAAPTPAVKTYQGQEPSRAVPPTRRPSQLLSPDKLESETDPSYATPHVMVQGWLNDVGSPAVRGASDVLDHAFPQDTAPRAKESNDSNISNATLTPAAFTPTLDDGADKTLKAFDAQQAAPGTGGDQQEVKPTGKPSTFFALGSTITGAIKSLMPAAAQPAANLPEHNAPVPKQSATAPPIENQTAAPPAQESLPDDGAGKTPTSIDTQDGAAAGTVPNAEAANLTDQPAPTAVAEAAEALKQKTSDPELLPRPNTTTPAPTATPDIPPRRKARAPTTGFSFTTTPSTAQVPSTPAPPGTYPPTPAPAADAARGAPPTPAPPGGFPQTPGGEAPLAPGAADRGPFVSFRAKQLLGHFLARDAPRTSADRAVARPVRAGRGNSLHGDEPVRGNGVRGRGGSERGGVRGGRGARRGSRGTE